MKQGLLEQEMCREQENSHLDWPDLTQVLPSVSRHMWEIRNFLHYRWRAIDILEKWPVCTLQLVILLGITQGMKFLSCRENCFQVSYQGGIGKNLYMGDFPGDLVLTVPTNAGDTGSIPGRIPHIAGRLSLCVTTTEPEL